MADIENTSSDNSLIVPLAKGLCLALSMFGVCGVSDCLNSCVIGVSESYEIRPEVGASLLTITMAGASVIMMFVTSFIALKVNVTNLKHAGIVIGAGLVSFAATNFGSRCLGNVTRHGMPALSRQKKFSSFFYFSLVLAELIPILGMVVSFMMLNGTAN